MKSTADLDADVEEQQRVGIAFCAGRPRRARRRNPAVQQAERERDEPGVALRQAGLPRREWMISAATNTIDSAISASTGGPGTWMTPSVASASVMLCAS